MSRQLAPAGAEQDGQGGHKNQDGAGQGAQKVEHHQQQNAQASVPITEEEIVGFREQDRFLPINNIQRLMKRSLPDSSKISKDAKECIQEATSEFISFITSEAADRATSEKRKTITGDDILNALRTLGFDEMSEVLLIYLAKYRELQSKEPARKRSRKTSGTSNKVSNADGVTSGGIGVSASTTTNGADGTAAGQEDHEEEEDEDEEEEEEEDKQLEHDDTFDMLDLPSDNE